MPYWFGQCIWKNWHPVSTVTDRSVPFDGCLVSHKKECGENSVRVEGMVKCDTLSVNIQAAFKAIQKPCWFQRWVSAKSTCVLFMFAYPVKSVTVYIDIYKQWHVMNDVWQDVHDKPLRLKDGRAAVCVADLVAVNFYESCKIDGLCNIWRNYQLTLRAASKPGALYQK